MPSRATSSAGRDFFRLSILAVRAFPVVILAIPLAVVFINFNIYDSVYQPGPDAHGADLAHHDPGDRQRLCQHPL